MPTMPSSARSNGRAASARSACWKKTIPSGYGATGCLIASAAWRASRRPITFELQLTTQISEVLMSLKEQLAEYRAGWFKRVPAERQAVMERHIKELRNGLAKKALKAGDRAPPVVLINAKGAIVDIKSLLAAGRSSSHSTAAAGAPTAISSSGPFSRSFPRSRPPARRWSRSAPKSPMTRSRPPRKMHSISKFSAIPDKRSGAHSGWFIVSAMS